MTQKVPKDFWLSIKRNVANQRLKPSIKPVLQDSNLNIPLSYNQEQLWQLDRLNVNSVHSIAHARRFTIKLNFTALEKSLREIVRRHAILRTTFPIVDGKPIQNIISETSFQVPILDLREFSDLEKEEKAKQIAVAEKQKPFNLLQESGFRVKLLYLSETESIFLLTMHHIIFDGVSFGILFRELKSLYEAFSENEPNPLPELPIQYADYAYWQRKLIESTTENPVIKYWEEKLQGELEPLKLPQDNTTNATFNYQGKSQLFQLSSSLREKLKTLSISRGVTLFTTLLTAFKILLYCYSKQEDIILVSPIACRDRPETKNLIGYFNNLLVLRSSLENNPTFLQLLDRVSETVLKAREHQDFPFKKLTDFPNLARIPLSRGMFALSNYQAQSLKLSEITPATLDLKDFSQETSNFDLSLSMSERRNQLSGIIRYKTVLFADSTITQMVDNFQSLLEKILDNPELVLSSLPTWDRDRQPKLSAISQQDTFKLATNISFLENLDNTSREIIENIEKFLSQFSSINKVIVIPQKYRDNYFIVYILPFFSAVINKQDFKSKLDQAYPEYADIYSILIIKRIPLNNDEQIDLNGMSILPMTKTGNVDIEEIPVAEWKLAPTEERLFYPHNMTQEMLSQVWSEVLGIESYFKGSSKFNIYDNFFELGGHSLATVKLIDRIEEVFQINLSISDLFQNQTIKGLGARIDFLREQLENNSTSKLKTWSHLIPIKTGGNKQPFFLIPGGAGDEKTLMVYGQMLFMLPPDRPVYGLRTCGAKGGGWASGTIHDSVEKLAAAYVKEIRQFQTGGTYIIAGECIGGIVAFEVAQQLLKEGCKVNLLLMDTLCPKGINKLYSSNFASLLNNDTSSSNSLSLLTRKAKEQYIENSWKL